MRLSIPIALGFGAFAFAVPIVSEQKRITTLDALPPDDQTAVGTTLDQPRTKETTVNKDSGISRHDEPSIWPHAARTRLLSQHYSGAQIKQEPLVSVEPKMLVSVDRQLARKHQPSTKVKTVIRIVEEMAVLMKPLENGLPCAEHDPSSGLLKSIDQKSGVLDDFGVQIPVSVEGLWRSDQGQPIAKLRVDESTPVRVRLRESEEQGPDIKEEPQGLKRSWIRRAIRDSPEHSFHLHKRSLVDPGTNDPVGESNQKEMEQTREKLSQMRLTTTGPSDFEASLQKQGGGKAKESRPFNRIPQAHPARIVIRNGVALSKRGPPGPDTYNPDQGITRRDTEQVHRKLEVRLERPAALVDLARYQVWGQRKADPTYGQWRVEQFKKDQEEKIGSSVPRTEPSGKTDLPEKTSPSSSFAAPSSLDTMSQAQSETGIKEKVPVVSSSGKFIPLKRDSVERSSHLRQRSPADKANKLEKVSETGSSNIVKHDVEKDSRYTEEHARLRDAQARQELAEKSVFGVPRINPSERTAPLSYSSASSSRGTTSLQSQAGTKKKVPFMTPSGKIIPLKRDFPGHSSPLRKRSPAENADTPEKLFDSGSPSIMKHYIAKDDRFTGEHARIRDAKARQELATKGLYSVSRTDPSERTGRPSSSSNPSSQSTSSLQSETGTKKKVPFVSPSGKIIPLKRGFLEHSLHLRKRSSGEPSDKAGKAPLDADSEKALLGTTSKKPIPSHQKVHTAKDDRFAEEYTLYRLAREKKAAEEEARSRASRIEFSDDTGRPSPASDPSLQGATPESDSATKPRKPYVSPSGKIILRRDFGGHPARLRQRSAGKTVTEAAEESDSEDAEQGRHRSEEVRLGTTAPYITQPDIYSDGETESAWESFYLERESQKQAERDRMRASAESLDKTDLSGGTGPLESPPPIQPEAVSKEKVPVKLPLLRFAR